MAICGEARINLAWQFDVNAEEGDLKSESPLMAYVALFHYLCRYDPTSGTVVPGPAVGTFRDVEIAYFIALEHGQRDNPPAAATYRECRNTMSFWAFAESVFRAALHAADFGDARGHIAWQVQNNLQSIQESRAAWHMSQRVPDATAKVFFRIAAMYYLLVGQRHNARR